MAEFVSSGGFNRGSAITPHDSTNLTEVTRAVYVGGLGDVVIVWADDSTSLFKAVPVGTVLNVRAKRINATSTTATLMIALY